MSRPLLPRKVLRVLFPALVLLAIPVAHGDVRVGMVFDAKWAPNDEIRSVFQQEITGLDKGKFGVVFPAEKCLVADGTAAGVRDAVSKLLKDPSVDIVVTLGVLASGDACRRESLPKPVVAACVVGGDVLGLPRKDGASGVANLVYLSSPAPFKRDVEAFHDLVPFKKLAILGAKPLVESEPELRESCLRIVRELGFECVLVPVADSVAAAVDAIPADADAVYVGPILQAEDGQLDELASLLTKRRLPSFSLWGVREVEHGVLATITPKNDVQRIARRTALYIQRILSGERPETLPVEFSKGESLSINMATARAIGFVPKRDAIAEAELLNAESVEGRTRMDLAGAVDRALKENLELVAAGHKVAAGEENIREAKSKLLPRLDSAVSAVVLDEDRAACTAGTQPERTISGALVLTQVLYAEPAWANLEAQTLLQKAREFERDRAVLDITLEASKAYINVLRAKTGERIRKDALKMTRSHLELAKVRRAVGTASPSEVYRWENELANSRKAAIEAEALRNAAEFALNRYLHLPQEEKLDTQDIGPDDTRLAGKENPLSAYLSDDASFTTFRDFMVKEGLARAPELQQYDSAIAAQTRGLESAKRSFYVPIVAMQAEVKNYWAESGEGAETPFPMSLILTYPDSVDWDVGIKASLPLYAGGSRKAAVRRAEETLAQLKAEEGAAREKIEQRIRSYVLAARASNEVIAQTRTSAEAARKALELASDAYAQGLVSIVELIDAQTACIVASELSGNSVNDFLINLMEAQRATGAFTFSMTDRERQEFYERLNAFCAAK